jgi:Zn-dependent membrane protease YugP
MPVLETGRYIDDKDLPAARSILSAAALTYVAAAAMTMLNISRWLRVLRF